MLKIIIPMEKYEDYVDLKTLATLDCSIGRVRNIYFYVAICNEKFQLQEKFEFGKFML